MPDSEEVDMFVVTGITGKVGDAVAKENSMSEPGLCLSRRDLMRGGGRWCINGSLVAYPHSLRVSADSDPGRHSERRHPVEHVAANFCLGPLIGQSPGAKSPADNGLVAIHCGFERAAAIVA
jgi:hypothetical protein